MADFGRVGLELDQFMQRERAFSSRSVNVYRLGDEYALRAVTSDGVDTVGVGRMVRIPTCASGPIKNLTILLRDGFVKCMSFDRRAYNTHTSMALKCPKPS